MDGVWWGERGVGLPWLVFVTKVVLSVWVGAAGVHRRARTAVE